MKHEDLNNLKRKEYFSEMAMKGITRQLCIKNKKLSRTGIELGTLSSLCKVLKSELYLDNLKQI